MLDSGELSDLQDFIVNLKDYADYRKASFKMAQLHNTSKSLKDSQGLAYSLLSPISTLKHNGPAVFLYFSFLKKLCIVFAVISLISLPTLASNYNGQALKYDQNLTDRNVEFVLTEFLMKFSLANQDSYSNSRGDVNWLSWSVLIATDLVLSLVVLVFSIYWAVELEHETRMVLTERCLPSYYTILVENLPACYTEESIQEYFNLFGNVANISTVRNVSKIVNEVTKIEQLLDELISQSDHNKMYKLYSKLIDEYKFLKTAYKKLESSSAVAAFISFDRIKNRDFVLALADIQQFPHMDTKLKISRCNIEPSNILWENFHIHQDSHLQRSILLWILLLVIFVGGITTIFAIRVHSKVGEGLEVREQFRYTLKEVITLDDTNITNSFCYQQGLSGYFNLSIHPVCYQFYKRLTNHLTLILKGSLIIIALNQTIQIILSFLANYRRYPTQTQKNVFLITSRCLTIFITNVLLMLGLECKIGGFAPREFFEWLFRVERQHKLYQEFSRKWYLDVGAQIIMTYILSVMLFPLLSLLFLYFCKIGRSVYARTKKLQGEMDQVYLDPQFDFNSQYGDILNCVFTCMTFSSGLPILYILCTVCLLIIFWTSKVTLLKLSRGPSPSDHTLNETITKMLPISLFVHAFMARYFFSTEELFPTKSVIPVVSMVFVMLLASISLAFRKDIVAILRRHRLQRPMESEIFEEDKSLKALLDSSNRFLYSYRIQDNREYRNVFYILTLLETLENKKRLEMNGKAKSAYDIHIQDCIDTEEILMDKLTHRRLSKESVW